MIVVPLHGVKKYIKKQKLYLKQSLEYVRDLGGTGYMWWNYKDVAYGLNAADTAPTQAGGTFSTQYVDNITAHLPPPFISSLSF